MMNDLVREILRDTARLALACDTDEVRALHLWIGTWAHPSSEVEHLRATLGLDRERSLALARAAAGFGRPRKDRAAVVPALSADVARCLERADRRGASGPMSLEDLVAGLLTSGDPQLGAHLRDMSLDPVVLMAKLTGAGRAAPDRSPAVRAEPPKAAARVEGAHPATPTLDAVSRDLSRLAREGRLGVVLERRAIVKEVARVLVRKTKANAVLLGEAGVGKTAIVEALAAIGAGSEAPPLLAELRVVELLTGALLAGTELRGRLEQRVQGILREAKADPHLVLFIDELHTVVGLGATRGSGNDLGEWLKPALARGELRIIGATTPEEYSASIEGDAALARRFHPVRVEEPSRDETLQILKVVAPDLESHHGVVFEPGALEAAVDVSVRHLPDRRLPDKARDALDHAAARARLVSLSPTRTSGPVVVDAGLVREVIAEWAGLPLLVTPDEVRAGIATIDQRLGARVFGQTSAVDAVVRSIWKAFAGLGREGRPLGSFLFVGPSGVGKTELAKAIAVEVLGDERSLIRFDMSEFASEHDVHRLVGAPPGYKDSEAGGQLTEAVRRKPFAVVLFDEVEKAHPRILDVLLQVLDDARLTDGRGRVADFSQTWIVLTSNAGSVGAPRPRVGFEAQGEDSGEASVGGFDQAALRRAFRPELLNRIDAIVPFGPLAPADIRAIVDKAIGGALSRAAKLGVAVEVDDEVRAFLARTGYLPDRGARELERQVERALVEPLASKLLDGPLRRFRVRMSEGRIAIEEG